MQKLIILSILILSGLLAYAVHVVIKKRIDPNRSVGYFLLYILLHLVSVFVIVFTVSFLIFQSSHCYKLFRKLT